MIFCIIILFIGFMIWFCPWIISKKAEAKSDAYEKLADEILDKPEKAEEDTTLYLKLREKYQAWYNIYYVLTNDCANIIKCIGIAIFFVTFFVLFFMFPISMEETAGYKARYIVYEQMYNKWLAGELNTPPYFNHEICRLQEDIEKKRHFREVHPFFSCYIGHELDNLDATKFIHE